MHLVCAKISDSTVKLKRNGSKKTTLDAAFHHRIQDVSNENRKNAQYV